MPDKPRSGLLLIMPETMQAQSKGCVQHAVEQRNSIWRLVLQTRLGDRCVAGLVVDPGDTLSSVARKINDLVGQHRHSGLGFLLRDEAQFVELGKVRHFSHPSLLQIFDTVVGISAPCRTFGPSTRCGGVQAPSVRSCLLRGAERFGSHEGTPRYQNRRDFQ